MINLKISVLIIPNQWLFVRFVNIDDYRMSYGTTVNWEKNCFLTYIGYFNRPHFLSPSFFSLSHTDTHTRGTSTHMGIWKVVLDICCPSEYLRDFSRRKEIERGDVEGRKCI